MCDNIENNVWRINGFKFNIFIILNEKFLSTSDRLYFVRNSKIFHADSTDYNRKTNKSLINK